MTFELSAQWQLQSQDGHSFHALPATMAFLGREDCDINIESASVDRRHAVITFDHYQNKFKVKDLGSLNGTFVNDRRIPDQTYITMEEGDFIKLGYDTQPYRITQKASQSQSHEEQLHIQGDSTFPRPKWEARPVMAECQGCIREQELHHTCGGEELSPRETCAKHSQKIVDQSNSESPLLLRAVTEQHRNNRDGGGRGVSSRTDAVMPEDPIPILDHYHTHKHHEVCHAKSHSDIHSDSNCNLQNKHGRNVNSPDSHVIGILGKRGTPLYGQPTWWGESGADEHHKQLLKDIQEQIKNEKEQQKAITDSIRQSAHSPGAGGDSYSLAFTVDLNSHRDSEGEGQLVGADTLSSFMPEQLRKSFRDRREKRFVEKSALLIEHLEKLPTHSVDDKTGKISRKPPIVPPKPESGKKADVTSSSFLINKMFYSGPDTQSADNGDDDDATEYSLYSEARSMNSSSIFYAGGSTRSSTMPELIHSTTDPVMSRSHTFDDSLPKHEEGDDRVSESGTYTIEEDSKELQNARDDIDRLFGVKDSSPTGSSEQVQTCRAELRNGTDAEEFSDQPVKPLNDSSVVVEVGSGQTTTTLVELNNVAGYLEKAKESSSFDQDAISNKPPVSPVTLVPSPLHSESLHRQLTPPQLSTSPTAVKKSAGRKLPSVPHSTDETSPTTEMPIRRKKDVEFSKEKILQELGIGASPVIQAGRPKLVEDLLTSRTHHRDTDPVVANTTSTFFDKIVVSSFEPKVSKSQEKSSNLRRSVDSVNTDILLKDTDEFMKAIHSFNDGSKPSNGVHKDLDKANNNNQVNGHSKPPAGKKEISNVSSNKKESTVTSNRKSVADAVTARLTSKSTRQPRGGSDSTEGSTESLNKLNISSKKSTTKSATLSSARPNRTFELRRARTESGDSDSSRSTIASGNKLSRSNSIDRTEVSLGAKIVQKSRDNFNGPKSTPIKRTDGGRYSMRGTSSKSLTPRGQTGSSTPRQSNSASANRPTSGKKPTSRNNNSALVKEHKEKDLEKEKEKAAWDRRRSYDPRRAVQQAKVKKQNEVRSSSVTDTSPRPRANSYSGSELSNVDSDDLSFNESSDTRHSADVFQPMESDNLKLNLHNDDSMDSSHELEIAKMSHELAKDLDILTRGDDELMTVSATELDKSPPYEPSADKDNSTEELVNSMFACPQQKSAFSNYRSANNSVSPTTASPALSPMRKKFSTSQTLENGSPSGVDQSYNSLVIASVKQLSQKLRNSTSMTVTRLREKGVDVSNSPSPTEEIQEGMPAHHELADILKTLKSVEHNIRVMEKALFDASGAPTELSTASNNEHEHYLAEIKRIRNEIAGFKPIEDTGTKKQANNSTPKSSVTATKGKTGAATLTNKTSTTSYKRLYY